MKAKNVETYDTSEYKYIIDWGDGTQTLTKTIRNAQSIVNMEVPRTIIPRYQNDIVIKLRETDEIKAVLPWIGIINDDPKYWCPPTKICPPTYGEWQIYGDIDKEPFSFFNN